MSSKVTFGNDLGADRTLTLVCFAVREEAKFFWPRLVAQNCKALVTGMGRKNALESLRRGLSDVNPMLVVTAGFAGGLNPDLAVGTVVFDEDIEAGLGKRLREFGAVPAVFHCSRRVAVTAVEKQELRKTTGADAVEMESSVIRAICRQEGIPSATIRVISDSAADDLPLDFNALMTSNDRINYPKLIWRLLSRPKNIPRVMKFQEQTIVAARKLGEVLSRSLAGRK